MTKASDRPQETSEQKHDEPWCDTTAHRLPIPPGVDDPGCHRIVAVGRLVLLIHRHSTGQIIGTDDHGRSQPIEDWREWITRSAEALAFVPRQRTA